MTVHASGPHDLSEAYVRDLIALALSKALPPGSKTTMVTTDPMTKTRAISTLKNGQLAGFVLNIAGQVDDEALVKINLPTFLGASDYRICFGRAALRGALAEVKTVDDLKPFSFAHALGWADTPVMRANGLKVIEVQRIDSIFRMMSIDRVDLFCRNLIEVLFELDAAPPGVVVMDGFLLKYPAPHYLHVHVRDRALADLLQQGLLAAVRDGSAPRLLKRYLLPSSKRFDLKHRRVIPLTGGYEYSRESLPKLDFLP
ncbi:hypothetical protein OU995_15535 [Roseateles sp. SL47]|uniref:hypothetical protein n=1 Tax=Roseateles sp. SL47 TaxID=2995138 RepID=UPI00226DFE3A|nr:hypothetical protein [Roseateles sp. SL47]WAC71019.1 hypothetical protein OU995_15535 [Roseateles sp. SL47]